MARKGKTALTLIERRRPFLAFVGSVDVKK
jgi:hypothetical protein